jgi:hypothetical protein
MGRYPTWLENNVKEAEKRRLLELAIDAYEEANAARTVTAKQIAPIVVAANSRFTWVWEKGCDLLVSLARKHPAARDAMWEMLNSRKVNVRFQIVACLDSRVPQSLSLQMIRQAIYDKGNRVRIKAAEAADRLHLKELLPDLESRLASEDHPNAKEAIEDAIAMLRDGYRLEYEGDERWLTVRTTSGWALVSITQQDIDKGRLQSIIRRTKKANAVSGIVH